MAVATCALGTRSELEATSRRLANALPYGDHRVLCRLLGEYLAFVDDRDLMLGPRLALDGFWESWVTLVIARHVQPGMRCVDVGANYGYYALLMAGLAGPEGRVAAFEPIPLLAKDYLPKNLALNGVEQFVEVCPKAVGNVDDRTVEFAVKDGDFASSALARWTDAGRGDVVRVQAITIDRLCADWPRLDLVKIDAEGAEALVWEGMRQTFRRFRHAVVVLELHVERDPPQALSLLHQIESAGYPLRTINFEGEVVETDRAAIIGQPNEHWALWLLCG
jgi:FkbM family methyltransferase